MVVEEACEVMEPTLISVLAVKSLWKLSLIGDHRQLPAFVQNCWYNLQTTHPCIKKSLFERLIDAEPSRHRDGMPNASAVPHTVLDEQRRMRKEIADITRYNFPPSSVRLPSPNQSLPNPNPNPIYHVLKLHFAIRLKIELRHEYF